MASRWATLDLTVDDVTALSGLRKGSRWPTEELTVADGRAHGDPEGLTVADGRAQGGRWKGVRWPEELIVADRRAHGG
jgi:hypothetical protein